MAYLNGEIAKQRAIELALANETINATNTKLELTNSNLDTVNKELDERLRENLTLTNRITSVINEVVQVAQQNEVVPERLLYLASGSKLGMSAASLDLIARVEFAGIPDQTRPSVGEALAGRRKTICLGYAYCLADFTLKENRDALSKLLGEQNVERLLAVDALDRGPMAAALPRLDDIVLSRRDAIYLLVDARLAKEAQQLRSMFPNVDELPPDSLGVMVSLLYSLGGERTERAFGELIEQRRFAEIPAAIRKNAQTLAATRDPIFANALIRRRGMEADLFEEGLLAATPTILPPP